MVKSQPLRQARNQAGIQAAKCHEQEQVGNVFGGAVIEGGDDTSKNARNEAGAKELLLHVTTSSRTEYVAILVAAG